MEQPGAELLLRIERLWRMGKLHESQILLVEYLKFNPSSARAWWLMSLTVSDIDWQRDCLERVIQLEPDDELARARLEMIKNQPAPLPSVNPFTVQENPDVNEPSEAAPAWAAPSEAISKKEDHISTPEPAPAAPVWAARSMAVPNGIDLNSAAGSLPPDQATNALLPQEPKKKWWILDILLAILIFGVIAVFAGYTLKQQQAHTQVETELSLQQQTLAMAQTLTSMPSATPKPTQTTSTTWTPKPSATFTVTSSPTPTLKYTLTRTPPPSGLIGPIKGLFAPDFTLIDQVTGQKVMLSQFTGQPTLIFFFSTLCPKCISEIASVESIYEVYKDAGLTLLTIDSAESAATVDAFRSLHKLTFPILLDPDSTALSVYRVDTTPSHFFVDSSGRITYIGRGEMTYDELTVQVEAILRQPPTATP